jgi:hypothetical protein
MQTFRQFLEEKSSQKLAGPSLDSYLKRSLVPQERFAGHVSWKAEPTLESGDLAFPNHSEKLMIQKGLKTRPNSNEKIYYLVTKRMAVARTKRLVKIDFRNMTLHNASSDFVTGKSDELSFNSKGYEIVDLLVR